MYTDIMHTYTLDYGIMFAHSISVKNSLVNVFSFDLMEYYVSTFVH